MPRLSSRLAAVLTCLLLAHAGKALGAPLQVVASDANGITLRVSVGAWSLSAPGPDGRVTITALPESHSMSVPGRPLLPAYSAVLALPPDARPTARVIGSEGDLAREGVQLAVAGAPVLRDDADGKLGLQPAVDAVAPVIDGPWPAQRVELSRLSFRGRRLATIEVRPFTYDASTQRLSAPLRLTVRVDFNRPAGAALLSSLATGGPDPHVDPVLEASVLNWQQGQSWRVAPTHAGGSLFRKSGTEGLVLPLDDNDPEVRVKVDSTGLYRLAFDDLAPRGYPANVPVGDVSVHRHEYVEGASPPYTTIELPSEVEDANGNGVFDSGDGIWVYVRTWAERSGATQVRRFWGDAEVVYATRKAGGGLRVPQRAGWNNVPGLTPLASFPWTRHFEKDLAPIMQFVQTAQDTNIGVWQWTDLETYYNRGDRSIPIQVNDIDTTQSVSVTTRWVGRKFDDHFLWAALANAQGQMTSVADSVFWYGKSQMVVSSTVHGSALSEGANNFFRQWGKNNLAPPDPASNAVVFAGLDWFDLTYWRRYRAIADFVQFNSADANGVFQVHVDNFSTDSIRVYDVTDPDHPVRLTIDPAQVTTGPNSVAFDLQDVAAGARRQYVAACVQNPVLAGSGPRSPPAANFSVVTRYHLYANTIGDYLLVTPEAFDPAVQQLVALRRSQGLSVVEAPAEGVYDEFDGGRHSGTAIQRFTKYAYNHWNSRFLLLVGDGTLDPNGNRAFSGKDWIPILPTPGPVGASEGLEIIPSDNRYGFITGNEDPLFSPDTNRVVPELMVGRLTVNSPSDANTVVAKIVKYEDLSQPGDWRRNILLNADDAFSGETTFGGGTTTSGYCHRSYEELFVKLNQTMHAYINSDSGVAGMNVEEFNLRYYLTNERTTFDPVNGDTCRVDRAETDSHCHAAVTPILLGKLNNGQLLWNYQGHANEFVLTHEDMYVNSGTSTGDDSQRLANDDKPFVFAAFSCHANMFARPEHQLNSAVGPCLGEDLLDLPNGRGAVASWASVCFEVVPRDDHTHINVELIRSMFVNPPRDETLGADDRGSRVVMGEVVLSALFRYLGTTQSYLPERGLAITYTLLGDPATRISVGRPFDLVTANGTPVISGDPIRLHTPGDTLRLEADLVSNVRLDSLGVFVDTGAGEVPVPNTDFTVSPAFPDTAAGGSFGGRHFRVVFRTQPEARSTNYVFMVKDRNGLVQRTIARLQLDAVLRSGGTAIPDNEQVAPSALLSLLLLSPRPLTNPQAELTLTVNGQAQAFTASPSPTDPSGREWVINWVHGDYPINHYQVVIAVQNGGSVTRAFQVTASSGTLALRDFIPFPNPFDNTGLTFSFFLSGTEAGDLKVRVFTQSGRTIYTNVARSLSPGYHQLAWDGRDSDGDELANGVYFYRASVTTTSGATTQLLGRMVKLRKPRHVAETPVP